ncbi:MAG: glycerophosphodiester phosphodiesterase family protein [Desulfobacterales bacterium]
MELPAGIEKALIRCIDFIFMLLPRPAPGPDKLKACKIVSHRGEHDNISVYENTFAAFDSTLEQGIWGIEFDVRWTRDFQPVVAHDPDLKRVFGIETSIAEVEFDELRALCPQVPLLSEVVTKYGRKMHFMIELKEESYPDPARQNAIFQELFSSLQPGKDYHLMTLAPEMFDLITFAPASSFIPIAMLDMAKFSRLALEKNYRGVAGHYLLLTSAILKKHHKKGQQVGTGYPASKNCLFREVNRGVEWIFSNNAGDLMAIINKLTEK